MDYPDPYSNSPQAVIDAVNAAFLAGGSAPGMLATMLDDLNNSGCPLGGTKATKRDNVADFSVSPVPFRDNITISYEYDFETDVKVEFFDARGRLIATFENVNQRNQNQATLDTSGFARGDGQLFFVKVTTNRGFTMKKIISKP